MNICNFNTLYMLTLVKTLISVVVAAWQLVIIPEEEER